MDLHLTFRQHTINLGALQETQQKTGTVDRRYIAVSGFLVSVQQQWYFVSAGHWVADIERAKAAGSTFIKWHINDSGAPGEKFRMPPPFDFDGADGAQLFDNDGVDYLILELRPLYVELLKSNGKTPLDERYWPSPEEAPETDDEYYVVGIPSETIRLSDPIGPEGNFVVTQKDAMMQVTLVDVGPDRMNLPFPRLIARTPGELIDQETGKVTDSIDGMSGGPLFAYRPRTGQYWVIGVQSGWVRGESHIAACYVNILVDWIKEQLNKREPSNVAGSA
jgi:hypothetical protein